MTGAEGSGSGRGDRGGEPAPDGTRRATGGEPAADGERRARGGAATRREPAWRAAGAALAAAFLLHGAAVSWVWFAGGFGRGGVLAWVDFPASLAYMGLRGGGKLVWSCLLGGLQWGCVAAVLSLLIGRSAQPPAAPAE